ncbi:MAG TPA: hypothetical protein VLD37_03250 [Candidatus Bilamarchaeum sp.]|nr:hypothetical protein [Candidatus Bilamarchaeum sp.]
MSAALAYEAGKPDIRKASYARLPEDLREWHKHFEASYFNFMCTLVEENVDLKKAKDALIRFRIFRNFFMSELMKFANKPGLITSLDEGNYLATTLEARERLFGFFPEHSERLSGIIDVPANYLPFIKVLEDPSADVLGQTFKFGPKSFMMVRSGSGRELDTAMHEYLHTISRGLPVFFEEGFCRHALQSRGVEDSDLKAVQSMEGDELRVNFAGIQYPALMVAMMSEAFGDKSVERAFFQQDLSPIENRLALAGLRFAEMDAPHRNNIPAEAAAFAIRLGKALETHLSAELKGFVERLSALAG